MYKGHESGFYAKNNTLASSAAAKMYANGGIMFITHYLSGT